jgi:hypothetical protein
VKHALVSGLALACLLFLPSGQSLAQAKFSATLAMFSGSCLKLTSPQADLTANCAGNVLNLTYPAGRSQFSPILNNRDMPFILGGVDSHAAGDIAVLAIDYVITDPGDTVRKVRHPAKGTCRYSNPYAGPSTIECKADTDQGAYEFKFRSDGKPPVVKEI